MSRPRPCPQRALKWLPVTQCTNTVSTDVWPPGAHQLRASGQPGWAGVLIAGAPCWPHHRTRATNPSRSPGCTGTSAYVLMGDRDRTHITGATAPVRALGGPSNARTGLPPCTSGCRLRGEGLSEGKTKVVGPPRRKNEGGAGQNFLKVTQNNLRKAKRRSNEGPAKENPGLRQARPSIPQPATQLCNTAYTSSGERWQGTVTAMLKG